MSIEAMKQALEAMKMLARYENPETKIQVRKPKDGGPIVTMYPHKVATDAADALRTAIGEAEKQEPVAWRNAAIRLGEELSSVGPDGYYNMTAEQWLDWAMDQQPQGKNSLTTPPAAQQEPVAWIQPNHLQQARRAPFQCRVEPTKRMSDFIPIYTTPPAVQRQPLTDERVWELAANCLDSVAGRIQFARAIEAAHGIGEKK